MRQTLPNWFLILGTILLACIYQAYISITLDLPHSFLVANTVILLGCSICAFVGSKFPSSPYQSVATFYAIFFGITPAIHLSQEALFWSAPAEVLDYYTSATWWAVAALLAFHFTYRWSARKRGRAHTGIDKFKESRYALALISICAALLIYAENRFSVASVFVRGGPEKTLVPLGQIGHLIFQFFVVPIPCVAFLHYIIQEKRFDRWALCLFVIVLLSSPPTSMARFQAAALYIAMGMAIFPNLMSNRATIPLGLLSGMLLVFPLLETFRYFSSDADLATFSFDFLSEGHFDSFQSFASALALGAASWGYALLGVFLFFVPRTIWPEKPIGSGAMIAEEHGFTWANISMNYLGEGYINFGFPGIILFAIVAGVILGRIDKRYWMSRCTVREKAQYLLLIGLVFFIARGDLLSSFAFTMGILASNHFIYGFATRRRRKPSRAVVANT